MSSLCAGTVRVFPHPSFFMRQLEGVGTPLREQEGESDSNTTLVPYSGMLQVKEKISNFFLFVGVFQFVVIVKLFNLCFQGFSGWCMKNKKSAYKMARCWTKVMGHCIFNSIAGSHQLKVYIDWPLCPKNF